LFIIKKKTAIPVLQEKHSPRWETGIIKKAMEEKPVTGLKLTGQEVVKAVHKNYTVPNLINASSIATSTRMQ